MNKILAILCGVGLAAAVAVIAYINYPKNDVPKDKPVENKQPGDDTSSSGVKTNIEKQVVAESFDNPCGVAVQPETGHIFISLKDRIVRVIPGEKSEVHDEVIGFPTDRYGKGPLFEFGPLGLTFADKNTLVVGDGSQEDGKEIVRIYTVGSQPPSQDKVRKAADMTSFSTPILPGDDSLQGEGNFFNVAILGSTVFVTSNGDDSKGWICKLELNLKQSPPLTLIPFIKSKELTDTNAPMGATISPTGKLVVTQFGSTTAFPDSLLTIYDPATGKLEKKYKTGLYDLLGVAYSPKTGKLYVLDFAWADSSKGGLFRLDINGDQVKAQRIATLERPTALAFSPSGKLYVTQIGSIKDPAKKNGQLLVFDGL